MGLARPLGVILPVRSGYGVGLESKGRRGPMVSEDAGTANRSTATTLTLGAVVLALTAGYVVLAATGRDTVSYLVFVSGPAVTAVVGAILARRTAAVAADVSVVRHQTNQLMTDQFDAASVERKSIAAGTVTVTEQPDTAVKG